jgi:ubiquinone biosynthesis protein
VDFSRLAADDRDAMTQDAVSLSLALPIACLVPDELAAYRGLVCDAFLFFLDHLPRTRFAEIAGEQLSLSPHATLEERVTALMRRCPTLHKLGQVMARDRRLPEGFRRDLQQLESLPPSMSAAEIVSSLAAGIVDQPGLHVGTSPLAEGSVAAVVPFIWEGAAAGGRTRGVLKILKPGIEERLGEDLAVWSALGGFLDERSAHYGLPVLEYGETLDTVCQLLQSETRLDLEQAHLAEAARLYADAPGVIIPGLFPFCSPRVTAMGRIHGRKVTDAGLAPSAGRHLAERIARALVATPFWSGEPAALFHADPHAGNLFVTPEGDLAILDWSLTARLGRAQRAAAMQIVLGGLSLDARRIRRALVALGEPRSEAAIACVVGGALRQVRAGTAPGFDWLVGMLDALVMGNAMTFPEALLFFRKALHSLSGVVNDVAAGASVDAVLLGAGIERLWSEWPLRSLAPFDSGTFHTHVSNADLIGLWAASPLIAARYWIGALGDGLESAQHRYGTASARSHGLR